ncbi:GntR family transcriptional regulator [Pseudooceanicola algae]|uniref:Uncharacterized protein n=1 Tax=Pseudooceanicola algae TaxID=1537215 RepID=A0A418SL32_9RHOB|nr:GntR family transcriptional regulator [Pseudooceanicola algae]QPM90873.1 hypothetical protein PSAL_021150 [Pseudooceanicola algae]
MSETVADRILNYIADQGLTAGDKLPAEVEMSRILGFSRNSMREAYSDLIAKSVIQRRHGVGTFVNDPPIFNSPGVSFGFWRMIQSSGRSPGLKEVFRDRVVPETSLKTRLEITSDDPVGRVRWLFTANGQPCVVIDHYLVPEIPLEAVPRQGTFNVLASVTGYIQTRGATLETINSAEAAGPEIASLLSLTPGRPLLRGFATIRGGDGKVALFSDAWQSPDLIASRNLFDLSPLDFQDITANRNKTKKPEPQQDKDKTNEN